MENHEVLILHDRDLIAQHLVQDPYLHLYELGDLDEFYWPRTSWYASDDLEAILLLYSASPPALLAMEETASARELLSQAVAMLPRYFHAQLAPGLVKLLSQHYRISDQMTTLRMALKYPERLPPEEQAVETLSWENEEELQAFYTESYPDHWFDPRMLATQSYLALRVDGRLASVAGVHVLSARYRAAALGNIATHPDFRGRGLAARTVGTLCRRLLANIQHIGLNVRAVNETALRCYRHLGFEVTTSFVELDAHCT